MNDFRELIVWQKAMMLTSLIYSLTKFLPEEERFALSSQMRRCAVPIPSNIAEGSKRGTKKDFTRFLRIAGGSAAGLETQMELMKQIYTREDEQAFGILKEVQKMLQGLISKR
jgi:four helix bundle protein